MQKGCLVTPSLKPENRRVQRRPRFGLFESLHPWPPPYICEATSERSGPSQQLKQRLLGAQRAQWSCNRTGRRSGKASPQMWHLSEAMLNSWSPACWITNVLIFWLHLLGTYQSHQVKEAIILLWPPKLLKWSHLQFLHSLAAHRGLLKYDCSVEGLSGGSSRYVERRGKGSHTRQREASIPKEALQKCMGQLLSESCLQKKDVKRGL